MEEKFNENEGKNIVDEEWSKVMLRQQKSHPMNTEQ